MLMPTDEEIRAAAKACIEQTGYRANIAFGELVTPEVVLALLERCNGTVAPRPADEPVSWGWLCEELEASDTGFNYRDGAVESAQNFIRRDGEAGVAYDVVIGLLRPPSIDPGDHIDGADVVVETVLEQLRDFVRDDGRSIWFVVDDDGTEPMLAFLQSWCRRYARVEDDEVPFEFVDPETIRVEVADV